MSNECASQKLSNRRGLARTGVAVFSAVAELSAKDGGLAADFSMRFVHRHFG
jgi:hypothetical protein